MVPNADGPQSDTLVKIFDQGNKLGNNVEGFANEYDADFDMLSGKGEFIGGDTREEGRAVFQAIVTKYEKERGIQGQSEVSRPNRRASRSGNNFGRWSGRLSEIDGETLTLLCEPDYGTANLAHIDPIPTSHPPSLKNPQEVPSGGPRTTSDRFLDLTNRHANFMQTLARYKNSQAPSGGSTKITTTAVNPQPITPGYGV
jgi:hypothetical protein